MSGSTATAASSIPPSRQTGSPEGDEDGQASQPLFLTLSPGLTSVGDAKKSKRKSNVYKVSGVNILNRNSVDSKTALERLQRRRENHNFVERRRRDNINHTITTLSTLIPRCTEEGAKLNKGNILLMAVDYIRDLKEANSMLAAENRRLGGSGHVTLPERTPLSLMPSTCSTAIHSHDEDDDPLSSTAASSPSATAGRKRSASRASPAEKRPMLAPPVSTPHSPQSTATHTPLPPIGTIAAPRAPAQSMPSSPSLRPLPILRGSSGIHHFGCDVSSLRHRLQSSQQRPAPLPPVSAQSLQSTPLMRPDRTGAFDPIDLPPIAAMGSASTHPQPASHFAPNGSQR
ncbi:hypothetical protein LPJ55_000547 [Coemansia sp. RSA 990]|nr:hypothetical protein LPJ68_004205 [Coemansia sp. RSA 1086]KAJ1748893.1 hypothetical protein LPJ79_004178 [Coemansia sp. RSA 1821]KAJ1875554.1 hypothetical protein LPJ55_000547 [Coemansia sp. RSA 990]KAJ2650441.1 hypothetical protein IWW40_002404 [Coemansia sp. RSA 1250]KAJ2673162.1 hypothetical protein IWW42_002447 [Coemansia sp. RSA 1085]